MTEIGILSRFVWETRYRLRRPDGTVEADIDDTWRRVAATLSDVEPESERAIWTERFLEILRGFRFLPGGRVLAGAGSAKHVTLFNCFVMGHIEDSMDGIFDGLKEGALTMQQGGGVGYDFSTLRPRGTRAGETGGTASGPVSFMRVWDAMCATLLSTGARRGAMMATLRCDHPDIFEFVDAKRDGRELRNFNLSVLASDAFMQAVEKREDWPLVFPRSDPADSRPAIIRQWSGGAAEVACSVHHTVPARELWHAITRASYDSAEPGVLFVDRINALNNLGYCEQISATNPCGEIPLPPYGACDLGSVNLAAFVLEPFEECARIDTEGLRQVVTTAVRLLDNVITTSRYPQKEQQQQASGSRRIGIGVTGLGDALAMLGVRYDTAAGRQTAASLMREICHGAYRASIALAREKGRFPLFDERYLRAPFVRSLPADLQSGIAEAGVRNSHLLAIAPAGTISLLANNVSSGIEPIYEYSFRRRILDREGDYRELGVTDYACAVWRQRHPGRALPSSFVRAEEIAPDDHLAMQAALQPYVDQAISKTVNLPADYPFERYHDLYWQAYAAGLKGLTTYRPTAARGAVLLRQAAGAEESLAYPHCCTPERESD